MCRDGASSGPVAEVLLDLHFCSLEDLELNLRTNSYSYPFAEDRLLD